MKRSGYSEDEAREILAGLRERKGEDEYKRLLEGLAGLAETAHAFKGLDDSRVAGNIATGLAPLVISKAVGDRDDIERLAERLTVIKSIMAGDSGTEELRREIAELKDKLSEKEKKELIGMVEGMIKNVEDRVSQLSDLYAEIGEIKKRIESIERPAQGEAKSAIERIEEAVSEVERLAKSMEVLGYKVRRPGESSFLPESLQEQVEALKRMGYDVRPPPSWQEIERMKRELERSLEDMKKRAYEQARQELERELRLHEKRMSMLGALALEILSGVMEAFGSPGARGRLQSLVGMLRGGEGGGERQERQRERQEQS